MAEFLGLTAPNSPTPVLPGGTSETGSASLAFSGSPLSVPLALRQVSAAQGTNASEQTTCVKDSNLDEATLERLRRCMERTGIFFTDLELLWLALNHASSANNSLDSNERLEFLGDSLLGFVASQLLYLHYPGMREGEMTRMKALMVSSKWCSRFSEELGLRDFVQLGKGITHNGLSEKVMGNLFEAFIGAVLVDQGSERAQDVVRKILVKFLPEIEVESDSDNPKSDLQHIARREFNAAPNYDVIDESGPDHQKNFLIRVRILQMLFPPAWGTSKKKAEKQAARNALRVLREIGIS
jgi:ribonuclease-3